MVLIKSDLTLGQSTVKPIESNFISHGQWGDEGGGMKGPMLTNNSKRFVFSHSMFSFEFTSLPTTFFPKWHFTKGSLGNFEIGGDRERMPEPIIRAFGVLKKCAGKVNMEYGLDPTIGKAIMEAAQEVKSSFFPLVVWQTGSGTQSNMNANERGERFVHPNDHVNKSQSSNDTFPTVSRIPLLHVILVMWVKIGMFDLCSTRRSNISMRWAGIDVEVKQQLKQMARALIHEVWRVMFDNEVERTVEVMHIAASVGMNSRLIPKLTQLYKMLHSKVLYKLRSSYFSVAFVWLYFKACTGRHCCRNRFKRKERAAHDAFVETSGALNTIVVSLMKTANDIRFLGSGPRCRLGELVLPENEPSSSIMPGKVNPTYRETLTMVCAQVTGNHVAISAGGFNGHFELNAFKPVIASNLLQVCSLFVLNSKNTKLSYCPAVLKCIRGIQANKERISKSLHEVRGNFRLVSNITSHSIHSNAIFLFYFSRKFLHVYLSSTKSCSIYLENWLRYNTTLVTKTAHKEGSTLKEAALKLGVLNNEEFDRLVVPEKMIGPLD
ncbi:Fumarate hydratase [Handroanthus impetiginosus]|uniref:fumarate hydratase n=1 Tax=Handroanthus impetiginosus TaxID=429701 RepID=A0A2G9GU06_9LAMI|nr:Fumarate hydratase [Handroanthus impetiginosus]